MVFSSLLFLYLFLPSLLIVYYSCRKPAFRSWLLIGFSFLFYAWGEPIWVVLLVIAALIGYLFSLGIGKTRGSLVSKAMFVIAIAINIGILSFFKYADFLVDNLNAMLPIHIPSPEIALPIGVSFFTFEIICYLTDVYKGTIQAPTSPRNILFYVSFFPHLVAGPIIRYSDIEQQIERPRVSAASFSEGITRFVIGLGKKVIFANLLGESVQQLLQPGANDATVFGIWFGICLFALQIYFDFSGYSDMAIGLGKMFGFELRENFNYPYVSKSAGDFWRRWNMSLGGFFRDYVYIPLGGNRKRVARNLFIVWFLTGLWHGASWNFIIWGLYFGALIYIERRWLGRWLEKRVAAVAHIYATIAMLIGWVWFYFTDLNDAVLALLTMFGLNGRELATHELSIYFRENALLFVTAIIACTPLTKIVLKLLTRKLSRLGNGVTAVGIVLVNAFVLLAATVLLVGSTYNPFLYYRF
ncbi:MBOAT family protein [Paenibacillus sp. N1-5-1-14]|uniref:MBOAT family O-acyltransferase n=1 Tax=Paenibacillus radicibacter TaxID=2972488 RepID=UPI002158EA3F|nr:MBOAT family O-acyltransferase [Paenibacillus radicibacter]MCR8641740.1 MBOAT family protein [Paenibacillus radicibacter]